LPAPHEAKFHTGIIIPPNWMILCVWFFPS